MREAIGSSILFYIILGFLALFIVFIALIMNYAACYRASNYVLTMIERTEGQVSKSELEEALRERNYYNTLTVCCHEYTNSSDNKTEVIRKIRVIDNIAPVITLKGSKKVTVKVNGNYEEEGYSAIDNYDGDITKNVKASRNVDFNKVGTYEIIYEVSDSFANKSLEKRIINVIENIEITYIKGILLVNKKYHLPANYNPGVNSEAYDALKRLQSDGMKEGYYLPLLSGFRSYETQKYLFNSYVKKDGVEKASTYSARPGQSEHQTGLAFDVGEISDCFGNTSAGIWLSENAHKYGFIIRYLKGKEAITGYKYEPWHIRYIGSAAEEIYNRGITLEEYLGVA